MELGVEMPVEEALERRESPHKGVIVGLYEKQGCSIEEIARSLHVPTAYVELVLKDNSPTYRADSALTSAAAQSSADIPDEMFVRLKEEAFQISLDRDNPVAVRANMIKFLWDKKRPLVAQNSEGGNVTHINLAIVSARETLQKKLSQAIEEPKA